MFLWLQENTELKFLYLEKQPNIPDLFLQTFASSQCEDRIIGYDGPQMHAVFWMIILAEEKSHCKDA